ncbi:MAG: IMPACT family protein [bacterium]
MSDSFHTITSKVSNILFKDKGSKFYGYAFPMNSADQLKSQINSLKSEHPQAGHFCFAYILGKEKDIFRYSDDGEPGNSAGFPIYGQLLSYNLTNILVVVVRYFGGTKLGVSGLKNAYKTTAKLTLEETNTVLQFEKIKYRLTFSYEIMSIVMRTIKELNLEIENQKQTVNCVFEISTRASNAKKVEDRLNQIYKLEIKNL